MQPTMHFLYQNIAYRKTGGDGSGNSHDLKIFENPGGGGEPGGDGTNRNIAKILQKAPVP